MFGTQRRAVSAAVRDARHAADLVGLTVLAEYGMNLLALPIVFLLAGLADGSVGAECRDMLIYLLVFLLPMCLMARISGWSLRELNGGGRPGIKVFVMAICLAIGWNLIASYLGGVMELLLNHIGFTEASDSYVLPDSALSAVVQVVQVALLPPLVEEFCFRGFYLKNTERAMGTWPAILLSSFAFWIAHDSITILPLAFGFGVLGGLLRTRYQSLLPSMCGHFAVNGSYLLISYIQQTASDQVQWTAYALLALVELTALVVGIILAVRTGLFHTVRDGWGRPRTASRAQLLRGVLTSIPFWLIVLAAVYFTARNMEVWM